MADYESLIWIVNFVCSTSHFAIISYKWKGIGINSGMQNKQAW